MPKIASNTTNSPGDGILYDDRWMGQHGIGRYAAELFSRIPGLTPLPHTLQKLHPLEPIWLSGVIWQRRPRGYFSPGFNPPLLSRVPMVLTLHDLNHLLVPESTSWVRRAYYSAVVKPGCRRSERILTGSEFSRQHILEWTGLAAERVVKVSYGISKEFTPVGACHQPGYPYILYVGLRGPHKNLPRLIRAFAASRIDGAIRLLLTGQADETLVSIAADAGCLDRLVFVGSPTDEKLAELYRGALALAMPSTFEGFGLPAVEAMACGTPALIARVGGLSEACGSSGLTVEPERIESIVEGIQKVVSEQTLRRNLIASGLAWSSTYRWDLTAARVCAVLAQLS